MGDSQIAGQSQRTGKTKLEVVSLSRPSCGLGSRAPGAGAPFPAAEQRGRFASQRPWASALGGLDGGRPPTAPASA